MDTEYWIMNIEYRIMIVECWMSNIEHGIMWMLNLD